MGQARFVECSEILKSNFTKGFPMERLIPVLPVNSERGVVSTLEEQGMGKVPLDENQVFAILFLNPIGDLINQTLSLFALCASVRELAVQDQLEGKTAKE